MNRDIYPDRTTVALVLCGTYRLAQVRGRADPHGGIKMHHLHPLDGGRDQRMHLLAAPPVPGGEFRINGSPEALRGNSEVDAPDNTSRPIACRCGRSHVIDLIGLLLLCRARGARRQKRPLRVPVERVEVPPEETST